MCVVEVVHACCRGGARVFKRWFMSVLGLVHVCGRGGACGGACVVSRCAVCLCVCLAWQWLR